MPYFLKGSPTRIYAGTIQLSMLNPETISLTINVKQTLARFLSTPNQWAQSRQLSMSTRTLAINQSMPNQWACSPLECFNENQLLYRSFYIN